MLYHDNIISTYKAKILYHNNIISTYKAIILYHTYKSILYWYFSMHLFWSNIMSAIMVKFKFAHLLHTNLYNTFWSYFTQIFILLEYHQTLEYLEKYADKFYLSTTTITKQQLKNPNLFNKWYNTLFHWKITGQNEHTNIIISYENTMCYVNTSFDYY